MTEREVAETRSRIAELKEEEEELEKVLSNEYSDKAVEDASYMQQAQRALKEKLTIRQAKREGLEHELRHSLQSDKPEEEQEE